LTIAVNTLRIVAAVELYRHGSMAGLTAGQLHRLLGIVIYLGALWGLSLGLDRLTARRNGSARPTLVTGLLVAGAYLGMTVVVPLLTGHPGAGYAEHAMMVMMITVMMITVTMITVTMITLLFLAAEKT
jgi:hypothetical protein